MQEFEDKKPELVFEWQDPHTSAKGWIVINSLRGGAAAGGTRMRIGVTKNEVLSLAKTMEIKFTVAGPDIGGGKSGIDFDPRDPRKEGVLKRWYEAVTPLLKYYYGTGGDLNVDEHHTIEDTAIALGESFLSVLGNKIGIERYAFSLPMDDCLAQVAIDFGGRSWLVWDADFKREKIGDMPTEMFYHFFKSFCDGAKLNANIKVEGTNEHHKIESIFKAFAKCIKTAVSKNQNKLILPSTKGVL